MLKGKSAIITGGSRGIGRAIALKLAENGADIAVIYAGNEQSANEVCAQAKEMGVKAQSYKCDVSDFAESKSVAQAIIKEFGGIDILVNNAGVTRDGLVFGMKEEDYDAVLDTNLKGAFNMIKHCYGNFLKRKSGRIINISSVSGLMGNAGQVNYSASKAGLIGLTKSIARELAGRGICCNAIAPGYIDTSMVEDVTAAKDIAGSIPLGRLGQPEDVAEAALFLAGNGAAYITGETIRVDGGIAM